MYMFSYERGEGERAEASSKIQYTAVQFFVAIVVIVVGKLSPCQKSAYSTVYVCVPESINIRHMPVKWGIKQWPNNS